MTTTYVVSRPEFTRIGGKLNRHFHVAVKTFVDSSPAGLHRCAAAISEDGSWSFQPEPAEVEVSNDARAAISAEVAAAVAAYGLAPET